MGVSLLRGLVRREFVGGEAAPRGGVGDRGLSVVDGGVPGHSDPAQAERYRVGGCSSHADDDGIYARRCAGLGICDSGLAGDILGRRTLRAARRACANCAGSRREDGCWYRRLKENHHWAGVRTVLARMSYCSQRSAEGSLGLFNGPSSGILAR